jgi:hypothetical protein
VVLSVNSSPARHTHIGLPHEPAAICNNAFTREIGVGLHLEPPPRRLHGREINVWRTLQSGAGIVVLHIAYEQPERALKTRMARDQHGIAAEFVATPRHAADLLAGQPA